MARQLAIPKSETTTIWISPRAYFWLHHCAHEQDRPIKWLLDRWLTGGWFPGPVPKFPSTLPAKKPSNIRGHAVSISRKAMYSIKNGWNSSGSLAIYEVIDVMMREEIS